MPRNVFMRCIIAFQSRGGETGFMELRIIDKFSSPMLAKYSSNPQFQLPCHSIRLEQVLFGLASVLKNIPNEMGRGFAVPTPSSEIGLVWIDKESSSGAQAPRGGTIAGGHAKSTSTRNGGSVPF